jgi:Xaa-Pro aminopeptidase
MAMIKTKKEIEYITKACIATDKIFTKLLMQDLANTTEAYLAKWILNEIKKVGLKPSFKPIVTSGARAGNEIHPKPTNEKLTGFVIIDFGVRYEGYCSDMTRTVFVGLPTKQDKDIYNKILKAQNLGVKLSVSGAVCGSIDKQVRDSLGEYAKYFIHTLGHGLGKKIHELPRMYYKHTQHVLANGMAITIEPGIYIPNDLGIRIEDTILVTRNGPKILTKSPKNLIVIKAK